jgi:ATP-dependent exoDNAse (exonuclease V) alpha subunit
MKLLPSDANVSISFQRLQFPLCVCFAMSINKSQGQTLGHVGLYLPRQKDIGSIQFLLSFSHATIHLH